MYWQLHHRDSRIQQHSDINFIHLLAIYIRCIYSAICMISSITSKAFISALDYKNIKKKPQFLQSMLEREQDHLIDGLAPHLFINHIWLKYLLKPHLA